MVGGVEVAPLKGGGTVELVGGIVAFQIVRVAADAAFDFLIGLVVFAFPWL